MIKLGQGKSHFAHREIFKLKFKSPLIELQYDWGTTVDYFGGTTGHFEKPQVTYSCLYNVIWYVSTSHLKEQFVTHFKQGKHLLHYSSKQRFYSFLFLIIC